MSCFICRRTGIRTCDAEEAEIRCMVCGFCERHPLPEVPCDTEASVAE